MGTGFEVRPATVANAAADVHELELAIRKAKSFAHDYIHHTWDGGFWLVNAGDIVNDMAWNIRDSYGGCADTFGTASDRLRTMARDYRQTDADARRRFDRKLRGHTGYYDGTYTYDGEAGDTVESTPGVSQVDVDHVLRNPGNANDGVQQFYDIEEKINKILSLGHEADAVTALGFENPFVGWAEDWEGNWKDLGVASAAMETLGDFWKRVGGETMATASRFEGHWSGVAAGAVSDWLNDAAYRSVDHGEALIDIAHEVFAKGLLFNETLTPLLDIGTDFVDTVTSAVQLAAELGGIGSIPDILGNPLSLLGDTLAKAKKLVKLIQKIAGLVKHVGKIINLVREAAAILYAIIRDAQSPSDSVSVQAPFFDPLPKMGVGG